MPTLTLRCGLFFFIIQFLKNFYSVDYSHSETPFSSFLSNRFWTTDLGVAFTLINTMDPITSVSAIYAAARVTTATRVRVREYIADSRASSQILGKLEHELAIIVSRLFELGTHFQDEAGSLGNKMMQQASSVMLQLTEAMGGITEMIDRMPTRRASAKSIFQIREDERRLETQLLKLENVKSALEGLGPAAPPEQ
jgi:methyl-accepting chemotaxis protein